MATASQSRARRFQIPSPSSDWPYFADFCCPAAKLIVELNGNSHDDRAEYGALRDAALQSDGWRVIRIFNRDLMHNSEGVWLSIQAELEENLAAKQKSIDVFPSP